jgi:hypothetical protein
VEVVGTTLRGRLTGTDLGPARNNQLTPGIQICKGDSVRLDIAGAGGSTEYTYKWACAEESSINTQRSIGTIADHRFSADSNSLWVTLDKTTKFFVTIYDGISGNTPFVDTLRVIVHEYVDNTATLDPIVVEGCEGEAMKINIKTENLGTRNWTINWYRNNFGNEVGSQRNNNQFYFTGLNDGDSVAAVAKSGMMCLNRPQGDTTQWIKVKINPIPKIDHISPKDTFVCSGEYVTLKVEARAGDGNELTYEWSPVPPAQAGLRTNPELTLMPDGRSQQYRVTVRNSVTGCWIQNSQASVNVLRPPVPLLGNLRADTADICHTDYTSTYVSHNTNLRISYNDATTREGDDWRYRSRTATSPTGPRNRNFTANVEDNRKMIFTWQIDTTGDYDGRKDAWINIVDLPAGSRFIPKINMASATKQVLNVTHFDTLFDRARLRCVLENEINCGTDTTRPFIVNAPVTPKRPTFAGDPADFENVWRRYITGEGDDREDLLVKSQFLSGKLRWFYHELQVWHSGWYYSTCHVGAREQTLAWDTARWKPVDFLRDRDNKVSCYVYCTGSVYRNPVMYWVHVEEHNRSCRSEYSDKDMEVWVYGDDDPRIREIKSCEDSILLQASSATCNEDYSSCPDRTYYWNNGSTSANQYVRNVSGDVYKVTVSTKYYFPWNRAVCWSTYSFTRQAWVQNQWKATHSPDPFIYSEKDNTITIGSRPDKLDTAKAWITQIDSCLHTEVPLSATIQFFGPTMGTKDEVKPNRAHKFTWFVNGDTLKGVTGPNLDISKWQRGTYKIWAHVLPGRGCLYNTETYTDTVTFTLAFCPSRTFIDGCDDDTLRLRNREIPNLDSFTYAYRWDSLVTGTNSTLPLTAMSATGIEYEISQEEYSSDHHYDRTYFVEVIVNTIGGVHVQTYVDTFQVMPHIDARYFTTKLEKQGLYLEKDSVLCKDDPIELKARTDSSTFVYHTLNGGSLGEINVENIDPKYIWVVYSSRTNVTSRTATPNDMFPTHLNYPVSDYRIYAEVQSQARCLRHAPARPLADR